MPNLLIANNQNPGCGESLAGARIELRTYPLRRRQYPAVSSVCPVAEVMKDAGRVSLAGTGQFDRTSPSHTRLLRRSWHKYFPSYRRPSFRFEVRRYILHTETEYSGNANFSIDDFVRARDFRILCSLRSFGTFKLCTNLGLYRPPDLW